MYATGTNLAISGGVFASTSSVAADAPGLYVYASEMAAIKIFRSSFRPFISAAVVTQDELSGCDANPCDAGFGCSYSHYSLDCLPCRNGTVSTDGTQCVACPTGQGPNPAGTQCDPCGERHYSNCATRSQCAYCAPPGRVSEDHGSCTAPRNTSAPPLRPQALSWHAALLTARCCMQVPMQRRYGMPQRSVRLTSGVRSMPRGICQQHGKSVRPV